MKYEVFEIVGFRGMVGVHNDDIDDVDALVFISRDDVADKFEELVGEALGNWHECEDLPQIGRIQTRRMSRDELEACGFTDEQIKEAVESK